jgi:hypothetical protein
MPTTGAVVEGRLPHPVEFVDAALFIGALRGASSLKAVPSLVPKLRDIYTRTGKDPVAVAEAAKGDQTVMQDLLSVNRDVPGSFIRDIERDTIYNDARSVKVEFVKTDREISLTDRPQLREYLESINPTEIRALKLSDPTRYLAALKDMVTKLFPEGAALRFRTENGVYDYEHLLKDATRQDYIATLPKTLKDADIRVEFSTPEGAEKAYLIRKYFDPDIQKDIWDMLIIQDGELKTKIARKGAVGRRYIESQVTRAGEKAPPSTTPPGNTGNAPTPVRSTGETIPPERGEVNTPGKVHRSQAVTDLIPFSEEAAPAGEVTSAGTAKLSDVVKTLGEKLDVGTCLLSKMGNSRRNSLREAEKEEALLEGNSLRPATRRPRPPPRRGVRGTPPPRNGVPAKTYLRKAAKSSLPAFIVLRPWRR